jgi:hypothetical protein
MLLQAKRLVIGDNIMLNQSVEHLENLIRVVSNIPDDKFDIKHWYNPNTNCGCAIGHAIHDEYFIAQKFKPNVSDAWGIANFFDIDIKRATMLFYPHSGHQGRQDMLASLRVLLLEKMALELEQETSRAWEDDEFADLTSANAGEILEPV